MATLKSIAARTGVSVSTVSKALKDSREISQETKDRVLKVARELDYKLAAQPGVSAAREEMAIGVICPELNSNYYTQLVSSLGQQINRRGYSSTIAVSDFRRDREREALALFVSQHVDGIVFISESKKPQDIVNQAGDLQGIPIVMIASEDQVNSYDCIHIDDRLGVALAVEHLIELGHRCLAYIGDNLTLGRLQAFREVLVKHQIPVEEAWIQSTAARFEIGGYQGMQAILAAENRPTAVFGAYDDIAIGAMKAIYEQGHSIPEDISVIGIDDIAVTPYLHRGLSTISNPIREMAMVSISILSRKMLDKDFTVVQNVVLKPSLQIRETTAAPR